MPAGMLGLEDSRHSHHTNSARCTSLVHAELHELGIQGYARAAGLCGLMVGDHRCKPEAAGAECCLSRDTVTVAIRSLVVGAA